jgi:hypothetical protein
MNLKDVLGCNPRTTLLGLVAIACAGVGLIYGKLTFSDFMTLVALLGLGGGLIAAKDAEKADKECKTIPPAESGEKE